MQDMNVGEVLEALVIPAAEACGGNDAFISELREAMILGSWPR